MTGQSLASGDGIVDETRFVDVPVHTTRGAGILASARIFASYAAASNDACICGSHTAEKMPFTTACVTEAIVPEIVLPAVPLAAVPEAARSATADCGDAGSTIMIRGGNINVANKSEKKLPMMKKAVFKLSMIREKS